MATQQLRSKRQKYSVTDSDGQPNNNIISHKRGEVATDSTVSVRNQKQNLLTPNGAKPTCADFGPDHETKYPGFFFCSNFKYWDDFLIENKPLKRTQKKYICQANHTNFSRPTHRLTTWSQNRCIQFVCTYKQMWTY